MTLGKTHVSPLTPTQSLLPIGSIACSGNPNLDSKLHLDTTVRVFGLFQQNFDPRAWFEPKFIMESELDRYGVLTWHYYNATSAGSVQKPIQGHLQKCDVRASSWVL